MAGVSGGEELCVPPLLPTIKTVLLEGDMKSDGLEKVEEDDDGCVTPKSEASLLKPVLVCPPPPRKMERALNTKLPNTARVFSFVPNDLESIFLPCESPPLKKIRAA